MGEKECPDLNMDVSLGGHGRERWASESGKAAGVSLGKAASRTS